ncbi:MAG: sigma-70 family RNA polymerase sigma factor [Ruminococcus sp.]|nr:sigma-70 family RNA polymerase sigma factor [Ruminococcus sp.]
MIKYYKRKRMPLFVSDGILSDFDRNKNENEDLDFAMIYRGDCKKIINNSLTKTQKSYIMLYYNDKKTVAEIAEIYGVNKSTVSRTINRAKKNIIDVFPSYAS